MLVVDFHADAGAGTHEVRVRGAGAGAPPVDEEFLACPSASLVSAARRTTRWVLEPLTFTPFLDRVSPRRLVDLYAYRPTDRSAILEFDRRISARYAELCAQAGEFYAGPFACAALGPEWLVEMTTYTSDDPDEVDALLASATVGEELRAIVDECRALQDREATRYSVRLVPRA